MSQPCAVHRVGESIGVGRVATRQDLSWGRPLAGEGREQVDEADHLGVVAKPDHVPEAVWVEVHVERSRVRPSGSTGVAPRCS